MSYILLESASRLLLQSGDGLLLEGGVAASTAGSATITPSFASGTMQGPLQSGGSMTISRYP